MNTYTVTVTSKYPAAFERAGELTIRAENAAAAIKRARVEMSNNGHTRQDGTLFYRAKAVRLGL